MGCKQSSSVTSVFPLDEAIKEQEVVKKEENQSFFKTAKVQPASLFTDSTDDFHEKDDSGLLFRGAVSNHQNLIAAVKKGDISGVTALLDSGADVNTIGMWNNSPLIVACQYGHHEIALKLLSIDSVDVQLVNERGATALLFACLEGSTDVVRILLERGAIANNCNISSLYNSQTDRIEPSTPLSSAIVNGHAEIVKLLLHAGCNVNAKFPIAKVKGVLSIVPIENGYSPALLACACGQVEILNILIHNGANLSILDGEQCSVIHHSCRAMKNSEKLLDAIFSMNDVLSSSQINEKDLRGDTALHMACDSKHIEAANILLTRGADVNARNNLGQTPLHIATKRRCENLIQILLSYHANVILKDDRGLSPIDIAYKFGKESSMYKLLLQASISSVQSQSQALPFPLSEDTSKGASATSSVCVSLSSSTVPSPTVSKRISFVTNTNNEPATSPSTRHSFSNSINLMLTGEDNNTHHTNTNDKKNMNAKAGKGGEQSPLLLPFLNVAARSSSITTLLPTAASFKIGRLKSSEEDEAHNTTNNNENDNNTSNSNNKLPPNSTREVSMSAVVCEGGVPISLSLDGADMDVDVNDGHPVERKEEELLHILSQQTTKRSSLIHHIPG